MKRENVFSLRVLASVKAMTGNRYYSSFIKNNDTDRFSAHLQKCLAVPDGYFADDIKIVKGNTVLNIHYDKFKILTSSPKQLSYIKSCLDGVTRATLYKGFGNCSSFDKLISETTASKIQIRNFDGGFSIAVPGTFIPKAHIASGKYHSTKIFALKIEGDKKNPFQEFILAVNLSTGEIIVCDDTPYLPYYQKVSSQAWSAMEVIGLWVRNKLPWYYGAGYTRMAIKFLNVMSCLTFGGKTVNYKQSYWNITIPKQSKPGVRLISVPRPDFKENTRIINELFNVVVPGSEDYNGTYGTNIEVLSYYKNRDFAKILCSKNLSIKDTGKFVLEIDLRDFFTNISPDILQEIFRVWVWVRHKDPAVLREDLIELLNREDSTGVVAGFFDEKLWNNRSDYDYRNLIWTIPPPRNHVLSGLDRSATVGPESEAFTWVTLLMPAVNLLLEPLGCPVQKINTEGERNFNRMLHNLTTVLPLWKVNLANVDPDTAEDPEVKINTPGKLAQKFKDRLNPEVADWNLPDLYTLNSRVSFRPWHQRGVPQGACFSGILANMVAQVFAHVCQQVMAKYFKACPGKITHTLVYSDNLYITFHSEVDSKHDLLIEQLLKHMRGTCFRKMVSRKKIRVLDRTKRDLKILGLLIDADGNTRLSRKTMRKINQAHIRNHKGAGKLTESDAGKELWYTRVRDLSGDTPYQRLLITERKTG